MEGFNRVPSFLALELHMNRLGRLDYDDVFGSKLKHTSILII